MATLSLALTERAQASWVSDPVTTPVPVDQVQGVIVSGAQTFASPGVANISDVNWQAMLLSPTRDVAFGPATTITLSGLFTDPNTTPFTVDLWGYLHGTAVFGVEYKYSGDGSKIWTTVGPLNTANAPAPVPEPSTCVAGALLLLPFGASLIRKLRKNRAA